MSAPGRALDGGRLPAVLDRLPDRADAGQPEVLDQPDPVDPPIALAVVTSDGLRYAGAVGVRKRGTETPVALDDLWHLGSDGKAMTSTLIARMVAKPK